MHLRKATTADIDSVMRVFSQAREAQRRAGFIQWLDGYPSVGTLISDISASVGYILDDGGATAGYVAIAAGDDEYVRHSELWDVGKTFAAFHRIALADDYRGRGLSRVLFDLAEQRARRLGVDVVRIDTGFENRPMHRILAGRDYINLGRCEFIWGERLAYEKPL